MKNREQLNRSDSSLDPILKSLNGTKPPLQNSCFAGTLLSILFYLISPVIHLHAAQVNVNSLADTYGGPAATGTLREVIAFINNDATATPYDIVFTSSPGTLSLGSPLFPMNLSPTGSILSHSVTVNEVSPVSGITIDGMSTSSIFFFIAPSTMTTFTINNLTLLNGVSAGGNGGSALATNAMGGCGGGALGAGGAIFVYQAAATIQDCNITNCQGVGGAGGAAGIATAGSGGGGGGGMLQGNGDIRPVGGSLDGGGGGGLHAGSSMGTGGSLYGTGGAKGISPDGPGGNGLNGGGGGGGGQGDANPPGPGKGGDGGLFSGGGGGGSATPLSSNPPGNGGAGAYGGGGGGAGMRFGDVTAISSAGSGGIGGGGGGGGGEDPGTVACPISTGAVGGNLNKAGYKGGDGGTVGSSNIAIVGGGGGGGAGLGGGIFVANNASLTMINHLSSTTLSGNAAVGGAGGASASAAGTSGSYGGHDIFCDNCPLSFQIASGLTQHLTSVGTIPGETQAFVAGDVLVTGPGTLQFAAGLTSNYSNLFITGDGVVAVYNGTQLSTGTVTFSGNGTIQALAAIPALASNFVISSGKTATLNTEFDVVSSGVISGNGNLLKTGAGIFTLQGTSNTYDGATLINVGTVRADAINAFSSSSAVTLANNATLDLHDLNNAIASLSGSGYVTLGSGTLTTGSNNANTTYSGVLSGSGGLIKVGTGIFSLSGNNNYGGTTQVNGGTLQAGSMTGFSSNSDFVVNNAGSVLDLHDLSLAILSLSGNGGTVQLGQGTLTLSGNVDKTFSGAISGSGGLIKQGTGIFTLQGTSNIYNGTTMIDSGTVRANAINAFSSSSAMTLADNATLDLNGLDNTIASLSGSGYVTLGVGTLTTGNNNASTTYSGIVSGFGGLTKQGTGNFSLSGANLYTGPTLINAGRLSVNGSIASTTTTVNAGGTLGGTGTVGGNVNVLGGTVTPGNSIGTLNILGNYSVSSSSTTEIEISPSAFSLLNISGTASLAGTLEINPGSSIFSANVTSTILKADGGLGGSTFQTVVGTLILASEGNNLKLNKYLMNMSSEVPGLSEMNDKLTASTYSISYFPTSVQLTVSLDNFNTSLSSISPARHAFTTYSIQNTAFSLLRIPSEHLANQRLLYLVSHAQPMPESRNMSLDASNLTVSAQDALPYGHSMRAAKKQNTWDVWVEGVGDFIHQTAESGNPAFGIATGGGMVGCDYYGLDTIVIGGCFGGAATSIEDANCASGGNVSTCFAIFYGSQSFGHSYLEFGSLAGYVACKNDRNISFSDFKATAHSRHKGGELAPYLNVGYDFQQGWLTIEPFARIDWVSVWQQSFSEKGAGTLSMRQKSSFSSMLRGEAGVHVYQTFHGKWGKCILRESLSEVVKEPFKTGTIKAALIGAPSGFTVESLTSTQTFFSPSVQIFAQGPCNAFASFNYEGEFGGRNYENEILLDFGMFF